jgi:hypothetical protein
MGGNLETLMKIAAVVDCAIKDNCKSPLLIPKWLISEINSRYRKAIYCKTTKVQTEHIG